MCWSRLCALILILLIGGCSAADTPRARFDDYLARLARVLDTAVPPAQAPPPAAYPAKRALTRIVDTPRTGWIGLFELRRCGLVNLISKRNSILGRVAPPQRRLAYESRLLGGLQRCRTEIDADTALHARLNALIARKRASLPAVFWNATFADDALIGLFSLAGEASGLDPHTAGGPTRRALAGLAGAGEALSAARPLDADRLGDYYRTLESSEHGGALLQAAHAATGALERATRMLEARLARRPLCFEQRPNRRARVLQTVLLEIYGQRVQPYLSTLVRAGRDWRRAVGSLIAAQHVTIPPPFARYVRATLTGDDTPWTRLDAAIDAHTAVWQEALGQCGLMPGAAPAGQRPSRAPSG